MEKQIRVIGLRPMHSDYTTGVPSLITGSRPLPMTSFDDYLPWTDTVDTETISKLDKIIAS